MRVLFLTNIPSPYRVDFFNALGKKCDLTVLFETSTAKDRDRKWVADKIDNFTAIFMKGIKCGQAEAFCPEVVKYVAKKEYDVVVVGMYSSPTGMLAIEIMKLIKKKFIISSDGGIKKDDAGIKHWIKEHFISSASAWLSTGKVTDEYLMYYGARKELIHRYPFTSVKESDILESPIAHADKIHYREKIGMKEDYIVLSVGQFIYRKGYDLLLSACRDLRGNIGVYIVGGKPTQEYLNQKKELCLDNVHFIDFMSKIELSNFYKAADIFVLPTREDIWGLVINEAMAYGLPVITTEACVAGVEMIKNSTIGKIIPSDNVESIYSAINEFSISHSVFRTDLILEISKQYSIENMADVHMNIFYKYVSLYNIE